MRDALPVYFRRDPQEPQIRLIGVEGGARSQVLVIEPTQSPPESPSPGLGFPRVEDVADLRAGRKLRRIVEKHGLPAYARWGLPTLQEARQKRCEIPLKILQDVARRALLITYARPAVRRDYMPLKNLLASLSKSPDFHADLGQYTTEVLSRHRVPTPVLDWARTTPKKDTGYDIFAQGTIWVAMNEAFDDLVPVVQVDREGRPALGFYAKGWWPLMVIDALQPRKMRGEGGYCAAPDCMEFVPPGSRRYCSSKCKERAKKQRSTHRVLTEREGSRR